MAGSVTRTAFAPFTAVIEKGRAPPIAGVDASKVEDSERSARISHAAKKPGEGGVPFTAAKSFVPSGEKMISDTVFGGPDGGVVWVRFKERRVPEIGIKPAHGFGA